MGYGANISAVWAFDQVFRVERSPMASILFEVYVALNYGTFYSCRDIAIFCPWSNSTCWTAVYHILKAAKKVTLVTHRYYLILF